MPIIISGDTTKSVSLSGDQSKSIQASQVVPPPPAYVIPGLEQSHWDVANAVVSGGLVDSIPDSSNVQALTLQSSLYSNTFERGAYNASGWQLNGKTLPTLTFAHPNRGFSKYCVYSANEWANKINNSSATMTVAMLVQPTYNVDPGSSSKDLGSVFGWGNSTIGSGTAGWKTGPSIWEGDASAFRHRYWTRRWTEPAVNCSLDLTAGSKSASKQLWMLEYANTSTGAGNFRFWINGTLQTESAINYYAPAGWIAAQGLTNFNFGAYFNGASVEFMGMNMAQAHIWKGALTDQQRTDVTAHLKSISGIV